MAEELLAMSMSMVSRIPDPCRQCVHWELTPQAGARLSEADRVFEKEAWLSGIMLTWGSTGFVAVDDDLVAGYVQFAPPSAVPGAALMPTGPVSADAVLLTAVHTVAGVAGPGLGSRLADRALAALMRRGVRAVEAFGQTTPGPDADELPCLLPTGFLLAVGFEEVRPHPHYPRLRYELKPGFAWQAEVEAALESLLAGDGVGLPTSAARVTQLV